MQSRWKTRFCSAPSPVHGSRIYLFTYGTLMRPELMQFICSRTFSKPMAASLCGYQRHSLKHRHYPGIIPRRGKLTRGYLYRVNAIDLKKLDLYEGDEYDRQMVRVLTRQGARQAWCYIWKQENIGQILPEDWQLSDE